MVDVFIAMVGVYWFYVGRKVLKGIGPVATMRDEMQEETWQIWIHKKGIAQMIQGGCWFVLAFARIWHVAILVLVMLVAVVAFNIYDIVINRKYAKKAFIA